MQFSIITPSFRSARWLKLCVPSVADQGVELEHLVQDSCSDDGTQDWLSREPRVRAFIEKDQGMYDAVNRGFRRSQGDILSYINCDEQYLPGALRAVWDYFQSHPKIEVVFADAVVVDTQGRYLCDRRASLPGKYHSWVSGNLSILTAATFFRRSLIDRRRLFFNDQFRAISDVLWVLDLLEHQVPMGVLPIFTSAFTDTGENMSLWPDARRESANLLSRAPAWARRAKGLVIAHYRFRRLLAGHYKAGAPFSYSIFTPASPQARVTLPVPNPTFRWKR